MALNSFLEHDGIIAFAHRGDGDSAPENTIAAFESAINHGYKYLETDVRCTKDGILVAFHDRNLDRLTDSRGIISKLDYSVISRARINGVDLIPTMEDLLGGFPSAKFNIDLKSDASVEPLVRVIRKTNSQDRVCIGSFSDARLKIIRTALPSVCTSMARLEAFRARLASFNIKVGALRANCAQLPENWNGVKVIDARLIEKMKNLDIPVHVWTVNDPLKMKFFIDLGINGIMTDRPQLLKKILQERGLWT